MGLILSSEKYSLEHTNTESHAKICCCSSGLIDNLLYNDPVALIFKEKNIDSPRWLYYYGNVLPLLGEIYKGCPLKNEYLEENSDHFDSFLDMTNHIKEMSGKTTLQTNNLAYQVINNNYLDQLA